MSLINVLFLIIIPIISAQMRNRYEDIGSPYRHPLHAYIEEFKKMPFCITHNVASCRRTFIQKALKLKKKLPRDRIKGLFKVNKEN